MLGLLQACEGPVAQASKPAVSPTSQSAGCRMRSGVNGLGNPRYSRLGSLRHDWFVKYPGHQLQHGNPVPESAKCEAFPPSTALAPHFATPALTGHRNIVGEDHGEMWLMIAMSACREGRGF